jgi:hypothetical protein
MLAMPVVVIPAQPVMQTVVLLLPAAVLVTPVDLTVPFVVRPA